MDLRIQSDEGDVLRLELAGRVLRSEFIPDLKPFDDVLGPAGYARSVSLSLAQTAFIDTRCLGWMLTVHKRFCQAGGRLVIHSVRPQIMEILTMLRFVEILSIVADEAAALELLRKGAS